MLQVGRRWPPRRRLVTLRRRVAQCLDGAVPPPFGVFPLPSIKRASGRRYRHKACKLAAWPPPNPPQIQGIPSDVITPTAQALDPAMHLVGVLDASTAPFQTHRKGPSRPQFRHVIPFPLSHHHNACLGHFQRGMLFASRVTKSQSCQVEAQPLFPNRRPPTPILPAGAAPPVPGHNLILLQTYSPPAESHWPVAGIPDSKVNQTPGFDARDVGLIFPDCPRRQWMPGRPLWVAIYLSNLSGRLSSDSLV
jgi:hypothetical protein